MLKVSCIIPAFNEAKYIQTLLTVVSAYPQFNEVIVVDDASTDETAQIVTSFDNIQCVRHQINQGKCAAVMTGFKKSTGSIIVLLDADLKNLTHADIDRLLQHSLTMECLTLAYLNNTWEIFKILHIDTWSGQRALPRWVIEQIQDHADSRYALESYINDVALSNHLPIFSVPWDKVEHVTKTDKLNNPIIGFFSDILMFLSIFRKYSVFKVAYQQIAFPLFRIKYQHLALK